MINLVKSVFALFIQLYLGSILTKYTFKMICDVVISDCSSVQADQSRVFDDGIQ